MTAFPVKRWDPPVVRINKLHEQVLEHAEAAVSCACRADELLIEQKKLVGRGGWLEWLAENVQFSERTARNFVRLARELPKLEGEDRQRVADLSIRDALAALATDTNKLSKLSVKDTEKTLTEAQGEPLRRAVSRTATLRRHQDAQQDDVAERVRPAQLEPEPILEQRPWRIDLCSRILALAKATIDEGAPANEVLGALSDSYRALQDDVLDVLERRR